MEAANPGEVVTDQITQVWSGMLAAMTAGGATRPDVVEVTKDTALAILTTTRDNLWPNGTVPQGEESTAAQVADAVRILQATNA